MTTVSLPERARTYLRRLCDELPTRRVGSDGNRAAADLFAEAAASFGFAVESREFSCLDWIAGPARLEVGGESFEAFPSPFSPGCRTAAPLAVVSTVEELESADLADRIVLLRGEVAREPLMPKNFPFYNPDEHRRIVRALEAKAPRAIVSATARNPRMAGAAYPCPLIEDGDFDIPSVYLTEDEGARLAARAGRAASLESPAKRLPSTGRNVIARRGADPSRRVVLLAHIDTKTGTPGAIDDAAGVATLLLLAEMLAGYTGRLGVEIVALNGEDYYAAPGEQLYLADNAGRFGEIVLGVNVDGVGYLEGDASYSLYGCPEELAGAIRGAFSAHAGLVEGQPWYQGDHLLFVLNQRPALAITSERSMELLAEVVHSPKDRPEIVDPARLAGLAAALRDLVLRLDRG